MKKKFLKFMIILLVVFSVCFFLPGIVYSQGSEDISITRTDFSNYPKVEIYINFKEGSELEALNLTNEDFTVLENGEKVRDFSIKGLSEIIDPIGVVLLLDTSGSMEGQPIEDAADAALLFMDEMRSIDEFSVISFADNVTVHSNFTSDRNELRDSILRIEAEGDTSLFDGVFTAAEQFEGRDDMEYRYVILLSDGMDTASRHAVQDAINKAIQEEVSIYSIALLSAEFNPDNIRKISERTGGEMLEAASSSDLKELYKTISKKIINQYRISYMSLWPHAENIEISINLIKDNIEASTVTSYENPYYSPIPEEVVIGPERPFYLTLFDNQWMRIIVYAAVFAAIALLFSAFILFIPGRRKSLKESAKLYGFKTEGKEAEEEYEYEEEKVRRGFFGWVLGIISRTASRRGYIEYFDFRLKRAGMSVRASEFITFHLIAIAVFSITVYYLSRNIILTSLVVIVVVLVPFLILNIRTSQRIARFHEQLPDALQMISGSLKAGYSFSQALGMVVEESRPPLSDEFKRILSEVRVGLPEKEALDNVSQRINSEYFQWVVTAINVQREVGGNLAEILDTVADTIRERDRILNRIKALTSEGKLSAIILIILPILVGMMMFFINRGYISLLITTKLGIAMLITAVLLLLVGIVWIIRIINIKY
jgi:tight adherence protein B